MHRGFQLYLDDILWNIIMRVYLISMQNMSKKVFKHYSFTNYWGGGGGTLRENVFKGDAIR